MTADRTAPAPDSPDQAWRGVATENNDDISVAAGVFLRARSRRLLGELLAPHHRALWGMLVTLLVHIHFTSV